MKRAILAVALLLACATVQAQDKMVKWLAECQADSSIDMTVLTSKTNGRIVELFLPADSPRNKEFLNVLDSERANATRITEQRKAGGPQRITSCFFDLDDKEEPESIMLIIDYKDNGDITVKARKLTYIGG